ncbi:MAG: MlaD family protein [Bacteroidota bacterium]
MTISNETKVGALTTIAIVLLILGFNFLKGKSLGGKKIKYFAVFENIQGLANSNPVMINGKQVGAVYNTDGGTDMKKIIVEMHMSMPVNIPTNSYTAIKSSLLGSTSLEIKLGSATTYLKDGDTISSLPTPGMLDGTLEKVDPVLLQARIALVTLDSVLNAVNSVFDASTKNNIKAMMQNLNQTTASLAVSSASLQTLLNPQTGILPKTLNNVNSFTETLARNNEKVDGIMTNVQTTTQNFANLDVQKTMNELNATVTELKNTVSRLNSSDGTLGLLMNDKKVYNNLTASTNKLNLLLDDIRLHPKRYINISVFGKKDKSEPLMIPLPDTVNAPYLNQ